MKNKKGFTIVELVIVIAVIAILAAVLIPTFAGVIGNANQSAALQKATSSMKAALAMSSNATLSDHTLFLSGDKDGVSHAFEYTGNKIGTYTSKTVYKGFFYENTDTEHATKVAAVTYGTSYNSIIINSKTVATDAKILGIINSAMCLLDTNKLTTLTSSSGTEYKFTVSVGGNTWYIFTSEDFPADEVCFLYSKVSE